MTDYLQDFKNHSNYKLFIGILSILSMIVLVGIGIAGYEAGVWLRDVLN